MMHDLSSHGSGVSGEVVAPVCQPTIRPVTRIYATRLDAYTKHNAHKIDVASSQQMFHALIHILAVI